VSGPSRYVLEAIRRRVDAGLCPVCGGKMVAPRLSLSLKAEAPRPAVCVNSQDGRHPAPARTKVRMKKVKLQLPPGAV
jgi:hypothetical protein